MTGSPNSDRRNKANDLDRSSNRRITALGLLERLPLTTAATIGATPQTQCLPHWASFYGCSEARIQCAEVMAFSFERQHIHRPPGSAVTQQSTGDQCRGSAISTSHTVSPATDDPPIVLQVERCDRCPWRGRRALPHTMVATYLRHRLGQIPQAYSMRPQEISLVREPGRRAGFVNHRPRIRRRPEVLPTALSA